MRTSSVLLFSAALTLGAAVPATAAVHQLGAVNISADQYTPVTWSRFDGPVRRLSLMPENDDIRCDHITVNYRNGDSYDVFEGRLMREARETITIPRGDNNEVRSVDFACKAENRDGARIALFAVSDGAWDDDRPAHVRTYQSADPDDR